ncbi:MULTISPECIES: restriction endonuclease fold toxin-2 domain-containing protein [Streptomyces]|uniref:restriction endonuclease fold toxin-2 domain-containing protein n=1 Tax=Streptomyces TaxID=1883 RepID=UPI001681E6BE|nr:restriction endonuclease fold toxin-2 domain-containing protein [Streptomyces venezuelae]
MSAGLASRVYWSRGASAPALSRRSKQVIEAKYVDNPNRSCYHSLDELNTNHR